MADKQARRLGSDPDQLGRMTPAVRICTPRLEPRGTLRPSHGYVRLAPMSVTEVALAPSGKADMPSPPLVAGARDRAVGLLLRSRLPRQSAARSRRSQVQATAHDEVPEGR